MRGEIVSLLIIAVLLIPNLAIGAETAETNPAPVSTPAADGGQDGLPIACAKNICGEIRQGPVSTPDKEKTEADQRLKAVQKALIEFVNANTACSLAKIDFLFGDLRSTDQPGDSALLAQQAQLARAILGGLTRNLEPGKLPNEADLKKYIAEYGGTPSDLKLGQLVLAAAKDRGLYSTVIDPYGATAAYRYQFPGLGFQKAAHQGLDSAIAMLDSAGPVQKRVFDDLKIRDQLRVLDSKFSAGQIIDETSAAQIRSLTGQVRWLTFMGGSNVQAALGPEDGQNFWKRYSGHFLENGADYYLGSIEGKKVSEWLRQTPSLEREYNQMSASATAQLVFDAYNPDSKVKFKPTSLGSKAYTECLSGVMASESTLPTVAQLRDFKAREQGIRQSVITEFVRRFCPQGIVAATKFVGTQEFYYPPDNERYLGDTRAMFEALSAKYRNCEKTIRSGDVTGSWTAVVATDLTLPTREIGDLCANAVYQPVRDHTLSLGGISVGSEAVKNPALGAGIEAHELGHTLSFLFESKDPGVAACRAKYQEVTKCVRDIHTDYFNQIDAWNKKNPPVQVDMGKQMGGVQTVDLRDKRKRDHYESEDFADLVAATAFPKENFWCGMFENYDLTGALKSTIKSRQFGKPRYLDGNPNDVHSSNLLRLLNVEVQSGRPLHNECKKLVESESYAIKKCLP